MPLYEHGYNISKEHQLAIGAERVEWLDFPFWTWLNQKQFILNRVGADDGPRRHQPSGHRLQRSATCAS